MSTHHIRPGNFKGWQGLCVGAHIEVLPMVVCPLCLQVMTALIFGQSFYGSVSSAIKSSKVYLNSEGIDKTIAPTY